MLDTCPLSAGVYKITAKTGPVGAGTCGNRVVVKDASIFFIMQNRYGPGNCTYSLYANHTDGVLDLDDNVVVEDSPVVNEWVITSRGGNTYTIVKKDTNLAWTDPEGGRNCEHQLHLTELEDYITEEQKFTIVRVEN